MKKLKQWESTSNVPAQSAGPPLSALERADQYIAGLEASGFKYPLVMPRTFIEGARDSGYRDTAAAVNELVDNAYQAGATRVDVVFGFDENNRSARKVDSIAVVDDGCGMKPQMIRASVIWGGTSRFNDRSGLGRFGFGLPNASVSQARRFTVFSRTSGDVWYGVTVDLDLLPEVVEQPTARKPPDLVFQHLNERDLEHGTVVVLEKLDRLSWKTRDALYQNLSRKLGVVYRHILPRQALCIDGKKIQQVDPLFLDPTGRHYEADSRRATALDDVDIPVDIVNSDGAKETHYIKVRFSEMAPQFGRVLPGGPTSEQTPTGENQRFTVLKENLGISLVRAGREIQVLQPTRWFTLGNYDYDWGCEISFSPALDEEFGITNNKQQVRLSDRIWDLLEKHNVQSAIAGMRGRLKRTRKKSETQRTEPAEKAAADAEKFRQRPLMQPTAEELEVQRKRLEEVAATESSASGQPVEEVKFEIQRKQFKIEFESMPGAPFYRPEQVGGQIRVYINRDHVFYDMFYRRLSSLPVKVKGVLDGLLLVLGRSELEAKADRRLFYENERVFWSTDLNSVASMLEQLDPTDDVSEAEDASDHAHSSPS
jgi:hypothetical protein